MQNIFYQLINNFLNKKSRNKNCGFSIINLIKDYFLAAA